MLFFSFSIFFSVLIFFFHLLRFSIFSLSRFNQLNRFVFFMNSFRQFLFFFQSPATIYIFFITIFLSFSFIILHEFCLLFLSNIKLVSSVRKYFSVLLSFLESHYFLQRCFSILLFFSSVNDLIAYEFNRLRLLFDS